MSFLANKCYSKGVPSSTLSSFVSSLVIMVLLCLNFRRLFEVEVPLTTVEGDRPVIKFWLDFLVALLEGRFIIDGIFFGYSLNCDEASDVPPEVIDFSV